MSTGAKKIYAVEDLTVGMFISSLDVPMTETPFPLQGFYIKRKEQIQEISKYCNHVMVNVTKSRAAKMLCNTMQFEIEDIPKALTNPTGFKMEYRSRPARKVKPQQKGRVGRLFGLLAISIGILFFVKNII